MPVKRCTLNGNVMRSLDDFYDRISTLKDMPELFGRNLDALWACLLYNGLTDRGFGTT